MFLWVLFMMCVSRAVRGELFVESFCVAISCIVLFFFCDKLRCLMVGVFVVLFDIIDDVGILFGLSFLVMMVVYFDGSASSFEVSLFVVWMFGGFFLFVFILFVFCVFLVWELFLLFFCFFLFLFVFVFFVFVLLDVFEDFFLFIIF